MHSLLRRAFDNLSGEWQVNLENRVPRNELYKARIASSKPSLGFFLLLICSAVIATLGLISNSTAVVIGAMIVAPLMDPILSLAFGLSIADNRLVKRSAITVLIGIATVVGTAWILASLFGASEVNREMTARTAPNLIDLVIAVASLVVLMVQGYGSLRKAWRHLLVWLGLLGLLCIPLSSALHDFSARQQINSQFARFRAGLVQQGQRSGTNPEYWQRIKLLYSNVRVANNSATIDIVLNVPQKLVGKIGLAEVQRNMRERAKNDYGIKEVEINISVIPTQILRYNPETIPAS